MPDLLVAGAAVVLLVVVTVVLLRGERLGRGRIGVALAVVVLAAGTFAVTLYRSRTGEPARRPLPTVTSQPATQGLGVAVRTVPVPMGTGDKYPQGALWLVPPRPGTDAYTGDLSLLCSTPGKNDKVQNCTGADQRVWSAEPLDGHATIGPADGDPFTDPDACADVAYQDDYLQLTAGRAYCARTPRDDVVALRVPVLPAARPLPRQIDVEVAVLH